MRYKTINELEVTFLNDGNFSGFLISSINLQEPIALEYLYGWLVELLFFCKLERTEAEIKSNLQIEELHHKIDLLVKLGLLKTNTDEKIYNNWLQNDLIEFFEYNENNVFEIDKHNMKDYFNTETPPSPQKVMKGKNIELLHPANLPVHSSINNAMNSSFTYKPITYEIFVKLLYYGMGVIRNASFHQILPIVLKPYPSNGARHELEFYISITGYNWLKDGLYHYQATTHSLTLIEEYNDINVPRSIIVYCTVLFERVQWRYRNSWNLRDIYMDYGHFIRHFKQVLNSYHIQYKLKYGNVELKRIEHFLKEEVFSSVTIY